MNFKFFRGQSFIIDIPREISIYQPRRFNNFEFCFQFDDNDPISFGTSNQDLHITVSPTENGEIIFNDNQRVFKIFARENTSNNHNG